MDVKTPRSCPQSRAEPKPPIHPRNKNSGAAFHYKSFPQFFKCAAQKSFHDIISCQYGKPVAYILKFKPGHRAATWQACSGEAPAGLNVNGGTKTCNMNTVYECEQAKRLHGKNI